MKYIQGQNRTQINLFPVSLDKTNFRMDNPKDIKRSIQNHG